MRKTSDCNKHAVFDFGEEDEAPEHTSRTFLSKFKNKDRCTSTLHVSEPCYELHRTIKTDDVRSRERDDCECHGSSGLNVREDNDASGNSYSALDINGSSAGKSFPRGGPVEQAGGPADRINRVNENMEDVNSSFIHDTDNAEYSGSSDVSDSENCCCELDDTDNSVVVHPDYIIFNDNYFTVSMLSFYSTGITLEYFPKSKETRLFKWDVADISLITSYSNRKVDYAVVTLSVKPKFAHHEDDVDADVDEVKFAVVGLNWFQKQKKIFSLHTKYGDIWNELDRENEFNKYFLAKKSYFPNFDDFDMEVVYPEGDTDAVSISKRDIALLNPDTFINDTIIDFYLKFLRNKPLFLKRDKFHFFNSFFFRKLADLDKDRGGDSFDGRAAFMRVRKWTRKLNLFEMDYIFIPVNFSFHWSLIVICHAGEVSTFNNENPVTSLKVPCILHMDSLSGSHKGLKSIIQCYLMHEWKERMNETSEDILSKFLNTRFVSLELPQQENFFDCGLFLLHYAEKFLEEAPDHFNPFKLNKFSNFLSAEWFPPSEVLLKRTVIQRVIHDIAGPHPDCSRDTLPAFSPPLPPSFSPPLLLQEERGWRGGDLFEKAEEWCEGERGECWSPVVSDCGGSGGGDTLPCEGKGRVVSPLTPHEPSPSKRRRIL